jgi:hypothetical protein
MDNKILIDKLNNTILYKIQPSDIDGIGIFSITTIPNQKVIIPNHGPTIGKFYSENELKKLNPEIKNICKKYFCSTNNKKQIFIPDDLNIMSNYLFSKYFINHSSNPNTSIYNGNIISIKEISNGEEITLDYETNLPSLFKELNNKNTKKNITNNINKKTQKKLNKKLKKYNK